MSSVLVVHYVVGILVVACAALLVWRRNGRRITLYILTLQLALGLTLLLGGRQVPPLHYALALLGWFGYMAANGIGRRPGSGRAVLVLTILSSLLVLGAFGLGEMAARGTA